MENKKIYLACPYSHADPDVMEARFLEVTRMAAILISNGCIVFSPITHSHCIAKYGKLDADWSTWEEQDMPFIDWCDEVWILALEGFSESVGVTAETKYAKEKGKQVVYMPSEQIWNHLNKWNEV